METREHRCILEGNRTHIFYEAWEGEFHATSRTKIAAIEECARRRDVKTVADANFDTDIIQTIIDNIPGNFYSVTGADGGTRVKSYDVCGNIVYLHPSVKCRWVGDRRETKIQDIAFS